MRILHRTHVAWALVAAAVAGLAPAGCSDAPTTRSAPPSFDYETIDVPDGVLTDVEGINASGTAVGAYWTADGRLHGFVKEGVAITTIDHPGAYYTEVRGIGPNGELVGDYAGADEEEAAYHGFRMSPDGEFTRVRAEGFLYDVPQRILPDGTILGCGHDSEFANMSGVTIQAGRTTADTLPESMTNGGANGGLQVVGFFYDGDHNEAFRRDRGALTVFMVPGSTATEAWDMNTRGEIVGNATVDGKAVGFVRTGTTEFTTVAYPGAVATFAAGINDGGDIVGSYVAPDSSQHGYIARRVR